MSKFTIFEMKHWLISHRMDSRYPGFLIVSLRDEVSELTSLSHEALTELGPALYQAEKLLNFVYNPYKIIIGKYGFNKGFSLHFHVLPVTENLLEEIKVHPSYTKDKIDGLDVINFVCREYCEKPLNDQQIDVMMVTISMLKAKYFEMDDLSSML